MDLSPYVDSLRRDLLAAAAAGTDETRRTADLLAAAMEPATRLAILDALSTATADVTAALNGVTVEVRLHGREPRISVETIETESEQDSGAEPMPSADDSDGTARVTLRLPESIKARAEEAASRAGISVNSWLVRAVARALDTPPQDQGGRPGRRLVGYARG
jgi:predicted HicB family RNase H-like nuclease